MPHQFLDGVEGSPIPGLKGRVGVPQVPEPAGLHVSLLAERTERPVTIPHRPSEVREVEDEVVILPVSTVPKEDLPERGADGGLSGSATGIAERP